MDIPSTESNFIPQEVSAPRVSPRMEGLFKSIEISLKKNNSVMSDMVGELDKVVKNTKQASADEVALEKLKAERSKSAGRDGNNSELHSLHDLIKGALLGGMMAKLPTSLATTIASIGGMVAKGVMGLAFIGPASQLITGILTESVSSLTGNEELGKNIASKIGNNLEPAIWTGLFLGKKAGMMTMLAGTLIDTVGEHVNTSFSIMGKEIDLSSDMSKMVIGAALQPLAFSLLRVASLAAGALLTPHGLAAGAILAMGAGAAKLSDWAEKRRDQITQDIILQSNRIAAEAISRLNAEKAEADGWFRKKLNFIGLGKTETEKTLDTNVVYGQKLAKRATKINGVNPHQITETSDHGVFMELAASPLSHNTAGLTLEEQAFVSTQNEIARIQMQDRKSLHDLTQNQLRRVAEFQSLYGDPRDLKYILGLLDRLDGVVETGLAGREGLGNNQISFNDAMAQKERAEYDNMPRMVDPNGDLARKRLRGKALDHYDRILDEIMYAEFRGMENKYTGLVKAPDSMVASKPGYLEMSTEERDAIWALRSKESPANQMFAPQIISPVNNVRHGDTTTIINHNYSGMGASMELKTRTIMGHPSY